MQIHPIIKGMATLHFSKHNRFVLLRFNQQYDRHHIDAQAGAAYTLGLVVASVDFKVGYRVIDHDFNYFATRSKFLNDGFFLGIEIDI